MTRVQLSPDEIKLLTQALQHYAMVRSSQPEVKAMGDLCTKLESQEAEQASEIAQRYRNWARRNLTEEGEVEIDPDAVVSMGDDPGAYVEAWLWVDDASAGIPTEDVE